MKNLLKSLGRVFSYGNVERYGIVLAIVVLLAFAGYRYFRHSHSGKAAVAANMPEIIAGADAAPAYHRQRSTDVARRKNADTLFYFNPNKAGKEELMLLGFTEKQAQVILNYQAAGGHYKDADDFRRCYVLNDEMYNRLRPWVVIPAKASSLEQGGKAVDSRPANMSADNPKPAKKDSLFVFDPNTVSLENLQLLGFSPKQAAAIDNYRKAGAVFRQADDFKRSYVVNDYMFGRLKPYIAIDTASLNRQK